MEQEDWRPLAIIATLTHDSIGTTGIRKAALEGRIHAYKNTDGKWMIDANDPTVREWIRKSREQSHEQAERYRARKTMQELEEENDRLRGEINEARHARRLMEQELMDRAAALQALVIQERDTNRKLMAALQQATRALDRASRPPMYRTVVHER